MNRDTGIAIGLFFVSWLLTAVITPYFIRLGRNWNILDQPGERKVHEAPTPRTGGIAIFTAIALVVSAGILFIPRLQHSFLYQPFFFTSLAIGGGLVFLIGLYDDVFGAGVWSRLLLESVAAAIVVFLGDVLIERLAVPFVGQIHLGPFSIPLTLLWIVGVTNAFNIIDGLDGLAGGITFIACFGVFAVAMLEKQELAMAGTALLAGTCLGFLKYNLHPARVFLGDCGALLLGFLLACISVHTSLKRHTSLALIIPMQLLAVPLLDTIYSMGRRLVGNIDDFSLSTLLSMFHSDRAHIHHILLDVGFSHPRAVWILYMLSTVITVFGVFSAWTMNDRISLLFLLAGMVSFLIIRHFGSKLPFIRRWKNIQNEENVE